MRTWRRGLLVLVFAMINLAMLTTVSTALVMLLAGDGADMSPVDAVIDLWKGEMLHDSFWWGCCGLPAIVVTVTQIIFITPLIGMRPIVASHGKPLMRTIIIAALIAAALSVGLLFAVTELCSVFEPMVGWVFEGDFRSNLHPMLENWFSALWPWVFICVGWIVWTPVLLTFARKRGGETRWGRMVAMLFAGTVVETLIVVPIDIMVRRRTECYCGTGSFFALIISMWALLWLTGPGIVIAATSKRRRLWSETHCAACGHAKGPSPGERCPECGAAWDATRQASSGRSR